MVFLYHVCFCTWATLQNSTNLHIASNASQCSFTPFSPPSLPPVSRSAILFAKPPLFETTWAVVRSRSLAWSFVVFYPRDHWVIVNHVRVLKKQNKAIQPSKTHTCHSRSHFVAVGKVPQQYGTSSVDVWQTHPMKSWVHWPKRAPVVQPVHSLAFLNRFDHWRCCCRRCRTNGRIYCFCKILTDASGFHDCGCSSPKHRSVV